MEEWNPKTELGRRVLRKEVTDINTVLDNGWAILEPQITDALLPGMESDLLLIGQSKGKFGGGRRRVFRQTQKKTREGNKPRFAAYAVIGNKDGIVGLGYGKARETVPARDKAVRQAKLNVFKIARGSGSWEGQVDEPHTIPFKVEGRCGSVHVILMPAPKGKGLVAEKEVQKILAAAGVSDVWSRTTGQTRNKINLIKATVSALKQLVTTKVRDAEVKSLSIKYGPVKAPAVVVEEPARKSADSAKPAKKAAVKKAPAKKGTPISDVSGVGPAKAKKLEEAGIVSAEDLARMSPEALVEKSGGSSAAAEKLIAAAKELVGGGQ